MEASNLPDAEFKTPVRRIANELRGRIDNLRENFKEKQIKIGIENKESVINEEYNT